MQGARQGSLPGDALPLGPCSVTVRGSRVLAATNPGCFPVLWAARPSAPGLTPASVALTKACHHPGHFCYQFPVRNLNSDACFVS